MESVAGPAQCAGVQYKILGVRVVMHVEVVVIWKGRTFGLLEHMLVDTTVGKRASFSGKGVALGKGLSKGWMPASHQFPERVGQFGKDGKGSGKEPAGGCWICDEQHYAKEFPKRTREGLSCCRME